MFKIFFGVIIGLALVAGGWWYYSDGGRRDPVKGLQDAVKYQGRQAVKAVERKVDQSVDDLKESIDKTGQRISQKVSDTTLLAKVKARLLREKSLDGFDIKVDVVNGVVHLKGTVPSLDARAKAVKLAHDTDGVKDVTADLMLKYEDKK